MSLYTNQMLANHKKVARYPKTLAEEKRGRDRGGLREGGKRGKEREGGRGERERKREGGREGGKREGGGKERGKEREGVKGVRWGEGYWRGGKGNKPKGCCILFPLSSSMQVCTKEMASWANVCTMISFSSIIGLH